MQIPGKNKQPLRKWHNRSFGGSRLISHMDARRLVVDKVSALLQREGGSQPASESLLLGQALGRVLSQSVVADRDYPPFNRSTRDGYAVRAEECVSLPANFEVLAEIKAGTDVLARPGNWMPGQHQCVRIMTGAAVPPEADAVVMLEHTANATPDTVEVVRPVSKGQNIVVAGSEARAGQQLLGAGVRLGYSELAIAAQVGCARLEVYRRPRVAILSTGDEVVNFDTRPGPFQIRNSNNVSLSAQAHQVGAEPVPLGNAADQPEALRASIERGLQEDALVISGGVSAGKYDLVEEVLRTLGAEFIFDAIAIRPGRPAVFAVCQGKPVFGLPGNPVSTMVTFELLAVPALDLLGGAPARPLATLRARLAKSVKEKPGLTHFVPAQIRWVEGEAVVEQLPWQGSGDIVALSQANCFLVVAESRLEMSAGEWADVLPIRGAL